MEITADFENVVIYSPQTDNYSPSEKAETFIIYSPAKGSFQSDDSFLSIDDISCLEANLGMGGCLISVHEPVAAARWIENNWGDPLLTSLQESGCCGPVAFMLLPTKPALALFGVYDDPFVASAAESLAELSGFPVVIRPIGDNPIRTLPHTNSDLGNISDQGNQLGGNNAGEGYGEPMDGDESTTAGGLGGGGRDGDRDDGDAGSDEDGSDSKNMRDKKPNQGGEDQSDNSGDDGGDSGGGWTAIEDNWESQVHSTLLKLRLKLNTTDTYAISIGYDFKFKINQETELPIDLEDLGRPLSQPEVIVLVDFKIETRARETQVDRSYANIGFVAHREESIRGRKFLDRGFDVPERVYKQGRQRQVQKGINATVGFSGGHPMATAALSYNVNQGSMLEATDSKSMPRCRVAHENGDDWDEDTGSYSSYNIAYQPQDMALDAERDELHPLEVKVGMGINLQPPGSKAPLPRISFINRNQVLIWVSDPLSKARVRGIVVLMSSYLDNIRAKEQLLIYERQEVDLMNTLALKPARETKKKEPKQGTISLSIAEVQSQGTSGSNKFWKVPAFIKQRLSIPIRDIPPHEFLARGWDAENSRWRTVLWPALDQYFRAADLERTSPVWKIQWKMAEETNKGTATQDEARTTGSGKGKEKAR
ncbi:hypothetical protein C8R44DRAFT_360459 [Mycena epipterygia]|nr:hypothetical protein C8R44DRAFT_360459 [Mycena epipterygia]